MSLHLVHKADLNTILGHEPANCRKHDLVAYRCVACVIQAYLSKQTKHLTCEFLLEFRMLNHSHHEREIKDLQHECDSKLSLNLLEQRFNEPLDRHLGVYLKQVIEICHEKLSNSWVIWCLDK